MTEISTGQFSSRLRELRIAADRSMGAVARAIGVTTVYYSEVENGRKHPFPPHSVDFRKLAEVVGGDQAELEALAARERLAAMAPKHSGISLKPRSERTQGIAVQLARCINEDLLSDAEIEAINQVLQRKRGDSRCD
jgi:transcriptional regulator with XRE-family HTH domain